MRGFIKSLVAIMTIMGSTALVAQNIGINVDGSTPHPSAILDVKADDKGFLMPRLNSSQRTMISSPSEGLMVFDTTTDSFWFYNGSAWEEGAGGGSDDGDWTVSGADVYRGSGRIGLGTSSPTNHIHLKEATTNPVSIQFEGERSSSGPQSAFTIGNEGHSINTTSSDSWVGSLGAASGVDGDFWEGAFIDDEDLSDILEVEFTEFYTAIPNTATINGYSIQINRKASSPNSVYDEKIRLSINGAETGANKKSTSAWPSTVGLRSYGGSSDTWGASLNANQFNTGQVGVHIQYTADTGFFSPDVKGSIDRVKLIVYYTLPSGNIGTAWAIGSESDEFRIDRNNSLTSDAAFTINSGDITKIKKLQLTSGAGSGKLLGSDENGICRWTDVSSFYDWNVIDGNLTNTNEGRVDIGSPPSSGVFIPSTVKLGLTGDLFMYSGSATHHTMQSISNITTYASRIQFSRSKGSPGVETEVMDGDLLGAIDFGGRRSTSQFDGARITSHSVGDWSSGSNYSADLRFSTLDLPAFLMVERMIINELGYVGIAELTPTFALHLPNDATMGLARAET